MDINLEFYLDRGLFLHITNSKEEELPWSSQIDIPLLNSSQYLVMKSYDSVRPYSVHLVLESSS